MRQPIGDPEQPARSAANHDIGREFLWFTAVGFVGFAIDVAVFVLLNGGLAWPIGAARAVSASLSIATTWGLNRTITFAARRSPSWSAELARYATGQGAGLLVNLGTFTLALAVVPALRAVPVVALALGAAAALAFNFVTARTFAFRRRAR